MLEEISKKRLKAPGVFLFPIFVALISTLFITQVKAFSGEGDGLTDNTAFQVTSCSQFEEINSALDAHYILMNDINCSDEGNDIIVATTANRFTGNFNGNGNTIDVLIDTDLYGTGLFSWVTEGGYISDLRVTGQVTSSDGNVGGVVGYAYGATITRVINAATVSGYICIGGIAGSIEEATISDSYNTGSVTASGDTVGGIVGIMYAGSTIENTYNIGVINGGVAGGIAGLIGSTGTINSTFNAGRVNGIGFSGGFVSWASNSLTANNNYNDVSRSLYGGCSERYGFYPEQCDLVNIVWQDRNHFKSNSSNRPFVDAEDHPVWDFDYVWKIVDGSYPALRSINNDEVVVNDTPSAPDAPTDLFADNIGAHSAVINWTGVSPEGAVISDYINSYSTDNIDWHVVDPFNATQSYTITNLDVETTYYFKVKAVNAIDESPFSEIASFTTLDLPVAPGAPTNLVAVEGDTPIQFNITWDAPEDSGNSPVIDYYLEVKKSQDTWDNPFYYMQEESTERFWNGITLPSGFTFDIRIAAANSTFGVGEFSNIVHFTTPEVVTHYIRNCSQSADEENLGLLAIAGLGYDDNYVLTDNIDCSRESFMPIIFNGGNSYFQGTFDGGGNSIKNLSYSGNIEEDVGLFINLSDGATIKNLNLINDSPEYSFSARYLGNVGAVSANAQGNVTIENVTSNINITGDAAAGAGGLLGHYNGNDGQLRIINSNVLGDLINIESSQSAGGLVDNVECADQYFKNCVVIDNSHVSGDITGMSNVGGLVGYYYDEASKGMSISNSSYDGGTITGSGGFVTYTGGLVGFIDLENDGISVAISNSESSGTLVGYYSVGGLVGNVYNWGDTTFAIQDSHSTMTISGNGSLGGLLGEYYSEYMGLTSSPSKIINSWYSGTINGDSSGGNVGGLIGDIEVDGDVNSAFEILTSYSEGSISGGGSDIGGLVGGLFYGRYSIKDSYSHADVTGGNRVGGLVGAIYGSEVENLTTIDTSYSSGIVSQFDDTDYYYAGGLVGYISNDAEIFDPLFSYASITNSFSVSPIYGSDEVTTGAFIGATFVHITLSNNYFDQTSSGLTSCVGSSYDEITDGCQPVNTDGEDEEYFINNHTNPPFADDTWHFPSIWIQLPNSYPVLRFKDLTEPVITLIGNSTIAIHVGDSYTDAGATAEDNKDGDITSSIVVTGSVNTSLAGTYLLNYDVCDSYTNCASTVTRSVTVLAIRPTATPRPIWHPTSSTPTPTPEISSTPTVTVTPTATSLPHSGEQIVLHVFGPNGESLKNTEITIDGTSYTTDSKGNVTVVNLANGNHEITIVVDGKTYTQQFVLGATDFQIGKDVHVTDVANATSVWPYIILIVVILGATIIIISAVRNGKSKA